MLNVESHTQISPLHIQQLDSSRLIVRLTKLVASFHEKNCNKQFWRLLREKIVRQRQVKCHNPKVMAGLYRRNETRGLTVPA